MVCYEEVSVGTDSKDLHDHIQIALANIPVAIANVEASYLGRPT